MTASINELVKEIEKTSGRAVSGRAIRLMQLLDKSGQTFEAIGKRDAASGIRPYSSAAFMAWGERKFPDDPEFAGIVVGLMQMYYMGGYEAGSNPDQERA